ncbi:MAG: hypothetical protein WCP46_00375 [Alphaproteobacteria bacterium]
MNKKEYSALHKWLRENYPKKNICSHCGTTTAKVYDWALLQGCEYSKDITCFTELCRSCHVKYDFTKERSEKISLSQIGDKNNFFGKSFTKDMKDKQRTKKVCKPIICTKEEQVLSFDSIRLAAEGLNLHKSNIIAFLKRRYNGKTYKGWTFTYSTRTHK